MSPNRWLAVKAAALNRLVMVLVVSVFCLGLPACSGTFGFQFQNKLKPVRIATAVFIGDLPVVIGLEKGLFRKHGLEVDVTLTQAGKDSLQRLLDGKVDIVAVAETPLIAASFTRPDLVIIGNMLYSNRINQIVARTDSGIHVPGDLRGKKVGLYKGTNAEYLLDTYLLIHHIDRSELSVIDMKPADGVTAFIAGEIDVYVSWQPYTMQAMTALDERAFFLPGSDIYTVSWLVVTTRAYAEKNPQILRDYLKALYEGEMLIQKDPEESVQIYQRWSGMPEDEIKQVMGDIIFDLSLDESVLINMEDQAQWMVKTNKTKAGSVPDYSDLVDPSFLAEVKKSSVTIVK